jgi:NADPH:quinone reductase-like Zn-dependent oxidoreductase
LVPPLILGAEFAGLVDAVGPDVFEFKVGDEVYGATNRDFAGAYGEYVRASAAMVARAPKGLSPVESASAPVVAVTAWQMLFDYAHAKAGQTVLVQGAAGNVGAYAVQLAKQARLRVFATGAGRDLEYVRGLGADTVVNYETVRFEDAVPPVDIVLDTVGRNTRDRSYGVLKPDGILVSVVTPFPNPSDLPAVRTAFFIVEVSTARLNAVGDLFDRGALRPQVGTVLPLEQARTAHEMLAGAPHERGKIVLNVAARATLR